MPRIWDQTYTEDHEVEDIAGTGRADIIELKIRERLALALLIEDTSGNVFGSGSDTDNLRLLRALVDDSTIELNGNQLRLKALGLTEGKIASNALDADSLADAASFEAAVTLSYFFSEWPWAVVNDNNVGGNTTIIFVSGSAGPTSRAYIPLQDLPNGATITSLKVYMESDDSTTLTATLRRSTNADSADDLASVSGVISTWAWYEDNTISNAAVDTQNYYYYIELEIDQTAVGYPQVRAVEVEMTVTVPLP